MIYLDELDLLDQDFSSSLSGVTEALEARTLRLPVDDGAKVGVVCTDLYHPTFSSLSIYLFIHLLVSGGSPGCQGCNLFSS